MDSNELECWRCPVTCQRNGTAGALLEGVPSSHTDTTVHARYLPLMMAAAPLDVDDMHFTCAQYHSCIRSDETLLPNAWDA